MTWIINTQAEQLYRGKYLPKKHVIDFHLPWSSPRVGEICETLIIIVLCAATLTWQILGAKHIFHAKQIARPTQAQQGFQQPNVITLRFAAPTSQIINKPEQHHTKPIAEPPQSADSVQTDINTPAQVMPQKKRAIKEKNKHSALSMDALIQQSIKHLSPEHPITIDNDTSTDQSTNMQSNNTVFDPRMQQRILDNRLMRPSMPNKNSYSGEYDNFGDLHVKMKNGCTLRRREANSFQDEAWFFAGCEDPNEIDFKYTAKKARNNK